MDKWIYGTVGILIGGVVAFPVGVYYGYKWSLAEIKKNIPFINTWDDVHAYLAANGIGTAPTTGLPNQAPPAAAGPTATAELGPVSITQNGKTTVIDPDTFLVIQGGAGS